MKNLVFGVLARNWRTKTFWVAAGGIVTAIGCAAAGVMDPITAGKAVVEGLVVICGRDAIAKLGTAQ